MKLFFEINDSIIGKAIRQFEVHNKNTVKYIDQVYICYNCFFDSAQLKHIFNNNSIVIPAFDINILHCNFFDSYARLD